MIKQKEVYTSPLTEVLVVRFEGALLGGSDFFQGGAGTYDPSTEVNWNGDF